MFATRWSPTEYRSRTSCGEPTSEGPDTGPLAHHVCSLAYAPWCCAAWYRPVSRRVAVRGSIAHARLRAWVLRRAARDRGSVDAGQASQGRVQTDEVGEGLLREPDRAEQVLDGGVHRGSLQLGRPALPRLRHRPALAVARSRDTATAPLRPGVFDTPADLWRWSSGAAQGSPVRGTGTSAGGGNVLSCGVRASVGKHRAGTMAK